MTILQKTITGILIALGLGAGGGIYYINGDEVPPRDLDLMFLDWVLYV